MPCSANPPSPVKSGASLSIVALSSTPPPWIHVPRPKIAYAMAAAWMMTSAAITNARTRYAVLMSIPPEEMCNAQIPGSRAELGV